MKKHLFLAVLMLLPMLAWADEEFTYSGVTYNLDASTYTAQVKKIVNSGDINVVAYVPYGGQSYKVTRFWGFCGNSGMTSISIPNTIERFNEDAFGGCTGLSAVYINDLAKWCQIHMTLGGEGSYTDSYSSNPLRYGHFLYLNSQLVTSVTIPSTITELGDGIFEGASCLTSVTFPYNLKKIGWCCFQECTGLKEVTIPNNVTSIGRRAFRGCSSLGTVTIGSGVTSIGYLAFNDCPQLSCVVCEATTPPALEASVFSNNDAPLYRTLVVPKGCKSAYQSDAKWSVFQTIVEKGEPGYEFMYNGAQYRVLTSSYPYTCMLVKGNFMGTDVSIPGSVYDANTQMNYTVTTIGPSAFSSVKETMTSVTIPSSITLVKEDAFYGCNSLMRVNINDLTAFCKMVVEDSHMAHDNHPTYYANHLYLNNIEITNLSIPYGVTEILTGTFAGCSNFKSVTFPSSLTSIGYNAFYECSGLTELTIPDNVQTIAHGAFGGCTGLTSVSFGSGVTSIGDYSFKGANLQKITMAGSTPPTLVDVEKNGSGSHAFDANVFSSASVIVPKGALNNYRANNEWNRFANIVELWGIGYPFEFFGINYVIQENNTLAVLPKDGGYSGDLNFPLTIYQNNNTPYTITTFGMNAFANCTGITSISIPATLTHIKEGAFWKCTGLKAVYISDLVAFCNLTVEDNMTAVDNHPTYIAQHLYLNGQEIRDLVIPDDNRLTKIKYGTFAGLSSLTSVTIPDHVTSIEISAFAGCTGLKRVTIPSSVTDIQSGAFQVCTNLSTIISLRGTAPSCASDAFLNVPTGSCVLWVPRGCSGNYRGASPWSSFLYTNELIMGDANVDGAVNAADVVEAVNAKKGLPSFRFLQYNVDQTGNGVDTSDINAVVNKALGK